MKREKPACRIPQTPAQMQIGRRGFVFGVVGGLSALPLLQACSGSDNTLVDAPSPDSDLSTGDWASGGTKSMTDKASYPDPFTAGLGACLLVASTTEGPCTTADDIIREDVSESWTGLPVRLALKVVDAQCDPLVGATVKIWHTNREGIYSGDTPNPGMCTNNIQDYISADFFRGVQFTDANGVAFFDTCFPGWYNGRAIHIHFQVKDANASYRISQLFFPEDVTSDIFATHNDYKEFGQPNTVFANDNIIGNVPQNERDRLILDVARMSDGAMLASKVVTVL